MEYYFWIKAGHLVTVFLLLSGMMVNGFLFRNLRPGTPDAERLVASARRWNTRLIAPALLLVWVFGLTLALKGGWYRDGWFMTKFLLVFLLSGLHGAQMAGLRRLTTSPTSAVTAVLYHSAPLTLATMAVVAILASVKPF